MTLSRTILLPTGLDITLSVRPEAPAPDTERPVVSAGRCPLGFDRPITVDDQIRATSRVEPER